MLTPKVPTAEGDVVISGSPSEARRGRARWRWAGRSGCRSRRPGLYDAALDFAGATVTRFDPAGEFPKAVGGLLILSNPVFADRAGHRRRHAGAVGSLGRSKRPERDRGRDGGPAAAGALLCAAHRARSGGPHADAGQFCWRAGACCLAGVVVLRPQAGLMPVRDLQQDNHDLHGGGQPVCGAGRRCRGDYDAIAQDVERQEAIVALLERHAIPFWQPDVVSLS